MLKSWHGARVKCFVAYASHIERNGTEFFRLTCEQDLEGIVAKLKHGATEKGVQDPESEVFAARGAAGVV